MSSLTSTPIRSIPISYQNTKSDDCNEINLGKRETLSPILKAEEENDILKNEIDISRLFTTHHEEFGEYKADKIKLFEIPDEPTKPITVHEDFDDIEKDREFDYFRSSHFSSPQVFNEDDIENEFLFTNKLPPDSAKPLRVHEDFDDIEKGRYKDSDHSRSTHFSSTPVYSSDTSTIDLDYHIKISDEFKLLTPLQSKMNKNRNEFICNLSEARSKILENLKRCNVLIIGEADHSDDTVWDVLEELNLKHPDCDKIDYFFVEHLYPKHILAIKENSYEEIMNVIKHLTDHAFHDLSSLSSLPSSKSAIKDLSKDRALKMISFIKKCLKLNIEVIALDNINIYKKNHQYRIELLNSNILRILKEKKIHKTSKALIYIGSAHTNHYNAMLSEQKESIYGIAQFIQNSREINLINEKNKLILSSVGEGSIIKVKKNKTSEMNLR